MLLIQTKNLITKRRIQIQIALRITFLLKQDNYNYNSKHELRGIYHRWVSLDDPSNPMYCEFFMQAQ